jgi:hypothetical protein
MTEAELWHMHLLAVENANTGFEALMTLVFAFLATAYFVGPRLTRLQAALLSMFFLVGAGVGTFLTLVEFRRAAFFMERLTQQFSVDSISPNNILILLMAVVLTLFIPGAIMFLYQMRHRGSSGRNDVGHGHDKEMAA